MRHLVFLMLFEIILFISCKKEFYPTNGETIYRTGKNKQGVALLDKRASQTTLFKSCQGCHGPRGNRASDCNITWASLTNTNIYYIPYTDSLFFRFLDYDLKSDGSIPHTGVKWQMNDKDKKDLIEFLKTL